MQILIADDSLVSRHLLDATLRKWGYEPAIYCYDADPGLLSDEVRRVADYRPSVERELHTLAELAEKRPR